MVIALSHHCLKPSSTSPLSSYLTRERMSSNPGAQQTDSKIKTSPVSSSRVELDTPWTTMAPLTTQGAPAKCLPRLQELPRGENMRARGVVVMTRSSEGSCLGSGTSTVVELPGINQRRHSVAGTCTSGVEDSNLEVFVSPLRRCSVGEWSHFASSSFGARERQMPLRRSGPGTTPIPPHFPRSPCTVSAEPNNNNQASVRTSYGGSKHFELTLEKIEETKPKENGFPSRTRRKTIQRKNDVASIDRQYLGGKDYQEFRSSVEGRRYANISDMPIEYAEELLSQKQEEDVGPPEETEDENLRQKCLKWLETLPQS